MDHRYSLEKAHRAVVFACEPRSDSNTYCNNCRVSNGYFGLHACPPWPSKFSIHSWLVSALFVWHYSRCISANSAASCRKTKGNARSSFKYRCNIPTPGHLCSILDQYLRDARANQKAHRRSSWNETSSWRTARQRIMTEISKENLLVIVPAFNEAGSIEEVLVELKSYTRGQIFDLSPIFFPIW